MTELTTYIKLPCGFTSNQTNANKENKMNMLISLETCGDVLLRKTFQIVYIFQAMPSD